MKAWALAPAALAAVLAGSPRGAGAACEQVFLRGDANADGQVDISDPVAALASLFLGGAEPVCRDAADADDSGAIDVSDPLFVIDFLFREGPAPAPPGPGCGVDETNDELECAEVSAACKSGIDDQLDKDGDGFSVCAGDCDDENRAVHPDVEVDVADGLDNDCDKEIDEGPFSVDYVKQIQPIWNRSCTSSSCHDATFPAEGLNLTAAQSRRQTVGVGALQVRNMNRIQPLDPNRSYLLHKLNGTQRSVGGNGTNMPRGAALLPMADRKLVETWIREGARP